MAEETTRVNFNAPDPLVRQADVITDLLDMSRTQFLVEAIRDEIEDVTSDEQFRRRLREAYYEGHVDLSTVKSVLGTEEAMRVQLLRESLQHEPPEPKVEDPLPSQEEFYSDSVAEWTPEDGNDERAER